MNPNYIHLFPLTPHPFSVPSRIGVGIRGQHREHHLLVGFASAQALIYQSQPLDLLRKPSEPAWHRAGNHNVGILLVLGAL